MSRTVSGSFEAKIIGKTTYVQRQFFHAVLFNEHISRALGDAPRLRPRHREHVILLHDPRLRSGYVVSRRPLQSADRSKMPDREQEERHGSVVYRIPHSNVIVAPPSNPRNRTLSSNVCAKIALSLHPATCSHARRRVAPSALRAAFDRPAFDVRRKRGKTKRNGKLCVKKVRCFSPFRSRNEIFENALFLFTFFLFFSQHSIRI